MGIRNLAFCLIQHTDAGAGYKVLAWDNVDLLEGGVSAQTAKACGACTSPAKWIGPDSKKWCQACATGVRRKKTATDRPAHAPLPCKLAVKELRALVASTPENGGLDLKHAKKDDLVAWANARYLFPWKAVKATQSPLSEICKAMDAWLDKMIATFSAATLIRLENQPVMKGPTMKSVQMILFTLLTHRLAREYNWKGSIEFVHAGTKTKDKEPEPQTVPAESTSTTAAESAAYRARKKTAEAEVLEMLERDDAHWLSFFKGRSKKSDLADAFLMAHRK